MLTKEIGLVGTLPVFPARTAPDKTAEENDE
jgi:hypothetical protein